MLCAITYRETSQVKLAQLQTRGEMEKKEGESAKDKRGEKREREGDKEIETFFPSVLLANEAPVFIVEVHAEGAPWYSIFARVEYRRRRENQFFNAKKKYV